MTQRRSGKKLNALEDALCEKYPDQEALLKQAFAGFAARCGRLIRDLYGLERHPLPDAEREDWEDILYYSVEDNKLYLTPPQDEESGDWGGMFGSEYPMVFERVD